MQHIFKLQIFCTLYNNENDGDDDDNEKGQAYTNCSIALYITWNFLLDINN